MTSHPTNSRPTSVSFADLSLPEALVTALAEIGYERPSPIQAECIPLLLAGRDLLGQAQTGTGKTAAFALPLLAGLDVSSNVPQALVLAPTRELAIQVAEAFQKFAHHLRGFHVLPLYGGQSLGMQLKQLARGPQVVVGTPGRVIDHLERESLDVSALRSVVLDEADEMLRMGFIDDVERILEALPAERQMALFSATMPEPIRRVAHRHLRDPREVHIAATTATVPNLLQRYWQVSGVNKLDALTRILEVEDELDAAIVFVRTKTATVELADKLAARGYAAAPLNGDMQQALRERTIEQLRQGGVDIVVATDVAARGIDVARISHVINYDIPYDTEAYVHRVGRTGRAGRKGCAILFVAPRERRMLKLIERATRQPIEAMSLPTKAALADRRVARFKQEVLDVLEAEELGYFESLVGQMEVEFGTGAERIAAALAWLAQKERPLRIDGADSEEAAGRSGPGYRIDPPAEPAFQPPPPRSRPAGGVPQAPGAMARYRVNVGRRHEVQPRDLVGAIANEGGIASRSIGRIELFEEFSTVELPGDLPEEVIRILRRTRVRQIPLGLELDDGRLPGRDAPTRLSLPRREAGARPAFTSRSQAGQPAHGKPPAGDRPAWKSRAPGPRPPQGGPGGEAPDGAPARRRPSGEDFQPRREGGWGSPRRRPEAGTKPFKPRGRKQG